MAESGARCGAPGSGSGGSLIEWEDDLDCPSSPSLLIRHKQCEVIRNCPFKDVEDNRAAWTPVQRTEDSEAYEHAGHM